MLKLHLKNAESAVGWKPERTLILRITSNINCSPALRPSAALLLDSSDGTDNAGNGFGAVLLRQEIVGETTLPNSIQIGNEFKFLMEGDVVRITPDRHVSVIYRVGANINSLLVTERCNSFCLMCSQPPREVNDSYLVEQWLQAIPLFSRATREIGITGGEPTLLGADLWKIVRQLKSYLPTTAIHMLSNGRNFKNIETAQTLAAIRHPDLMVGIPLYSDVAAIHDFVVQADGAFDETVRGLLNLGRCSVPIELRIVVHRTTYERLPELARFIVRNLQFVDKVALMGLEITGFTKVNLDELWIDPLDYQAELKEAVAVLSRGNVRPTIYNHQLCLLDKELWPIAVKSISDWKNEYMPECAGCAEMHRCGGFFSSAHIKRSSHIQPLS